MTTLNRDFIEGPQGSFSVSTVQTFAGGAPDSRPLFSPFSASDYAEETTWPYETMVFKVGEGSKGYYHRAYATEEAAQQGHTETVQLLENGTLPLGQGVDGPFGNPTLTPEEWQKQAKPVA